jgi:hypothetical protein
VKHENVDARFFGQKSGRERERGEEREREDCMGTTRRIAI